MKWTWDDIIIFPLIVLAVIFNGICDAWNRISGFFYHLRHRR